MRKAKVFVHGELAGFLIENNPKNYQFQYLENYAKEPVSLTMPIEQQLYRFEGFPPFFEGLLPEGIMLKGLLRQLKIDTDDYFSQILATGEDLVGTVTVKSFEDE